MLPPYLTFLKYIHTNEWVNITKKYPVIKVGTDCSGIDAPLHL